MIIEIINPATREKINTYTEMTTKEVEVSLETAHEAFRNWRETSFSRRAEKLKSAAKILRQKSGELAELMAREMGKPLAQGNAEIEKCAWVCDYYADEGERLLQLEIVKTDASKSYVCFDPLGSILAVMPWNFPFWQAFRCAAPIIMAGNAYVLKHAANVTGCALAMEQIFEQAGFPEGLFTTLVVGSERVAGLIEHRLIQAVTLTGGTGAGKAIAGKAGQMIKKSVLELGGSDPYIVLEDADLDLASGTCAASRMINTGQSCIAAKRFIVAQSVKSKFEELFVAKMKEFKMGNPLEIGVTAGPLARHDLRDGLHDSVQQTIKAGAKLLLGGKIPDNSGAFYPATVLTDVRPGMHAFDNETFGPVATITSVKNEDEAIQLANASPFGLGSAVFTRDVARGEKVARKLEAGSCFVNAHVRSDPRLPFGGIKLSGYGRELSVYGIREFVNIKTVYIK